jgi:hypothetical protein
MFAGFTHTVAVSTALNAVSICLLMDIWVIFPFFFSFSGGGGTGD